jgi:L-alanine-DL-glutamate epimerase-like enolase superfamily enzyme
MKITDVKTEVYQIPYHGEFHPTWFPGGVEKELVILLVRVETDEGIEGLASAEAPFGLLPIIKSTVEYLRTALIGESPFEVEKLIFKIRKGAIISMRPWIVENALWDIIGKASNQPVYRIFGAGRNRVPIYAAWGELRPNEQRVEDAHRLIEEGFKAVKIRLHYPKMEDDIALVTAVRKSVGDKLEIMIDANQGTAIERGTPENELWSYQRALYTARALEELGVAWLEEPRHRFDVDSLARLSKEVNIPIAGGEVNRGIHEFRWLLEHDCFAILQPNCTMSEGMSQIRKIAALAEAYGKLCTPHNWIPGVGLIATMHLCAAIPNSTYLEYPYDPPVLVPEVFQGILKNPVRVEADGCVTVPDGPGFGVELDEDKLKKYRMQ